METGGFLHGDGVPGPVRRGERPFFSEKLTAPLDFSVGVWYIEFRF